MVLVSRMGQEVIPVLPTDFCGILDSVLKGALEFTVTPTGPGISWEGFWLKSVSLIDVEVLRLSISSCIVCTFHQIYCCKAVPLLLWCLEEVSPSCSWEWLCVCSFSLDWFNESLPITLQNQLLALLIAFYFIDFGLIFVISLLCIFGIKYAFFFSKFSWWKFNFKPFFW